MVLWWNFVIFLFSFGIAQKNCGKSRVIIPAPVFGDGENLSAEKCGIWDTRTNRNAPWYVLLRNPRGSNCYGSLISLTSVLVYDCGSNAGEFANSENKDDWVADLGKCAPSTDYDKCTQNGEGQIVKIRSVTQVNATGFPIPLHIWKIEKVILKENFIAPICIFNKGNLQDFDRRQQYTAFHFYWRRDANFSATLSEDLGPCLNQSKDFKNCDKVDKNFLCARFSEDQYLPYLSHQERNRHFLRAIEVEGIKKRDKFYYNVYFILDQIVSLSGDIPLLPQIPKTKMKTVFKNGQSFPGCGMRTSRIRRNPTDFIVRGKDTNEYAHPWHAAMLTGSAKFNGYRCGGTLISTTAVLTAAHCVFGEDQNVLEPQDFEFVFGTINMTAFLPTSDDTYKQTVFPSQVIPHPEYDRVTKEHDLAVVLLEEPVEITKAVNPICLWQEEYTLDQNSKFKGKVVGWGRTEKHSVSEILQEADLRIVPYFECFLTKKDFFTKYLKPTRNFCAGEKGTTACLGDSGGGFYINKGRTWYLRGIVSFGWTVDGTINGEVVQVCEGDIPSLYLDVTNFMDWIVEKANLTENVKGPYASFWNERTQEDITELSGATVFLCPPCVMLSVCFAVLMWTRL